MKRIFTYGGLVTDAIDDKAAKEFWGLTSYVGLFDITYGLSTLAEARLGPWPHDGGMLVHLTPEDMAAIKASEEDQRDAEWWRVEAQGLAERLNAAVLAKIGLDEELAGLRLDHNNLTMASIACQQALDKAEADLKAGKEKIALLEEIEADRAKEAQRFRKEAAVGIMGKTIEQLEAELQEIQKRALTDEDELAARQLEDAQAFLMRHPMELDEVAPSVSDTSPDGLGADTSPAIAGEEGAKPHCGNPDRKPGESCILCVPGSGFVCEVVSPTPVALVTPSEESPMSFEAPTGGRATAQEIMRREWPAGTLTEDIIALMQKYAPGAPSWATNKARLGIEAARLGLKRPAGFRATLAKAVAGPVVVVTPVPEMSSRVRKAEPPKATVVAGPAGGSMAAAAPVPNARIMGVGQLPPAPPKSEPVKAPALAISAQSPITRSYGPFVEKLHLKGLSFDDIKRRMNKELPRDFTREDVALIVMEMGL